MGILKKLVAVLLFGWGMHAPAEEAVREDTLRHGAVEVRLEPFPPLVNEDGTGLAIDLLALVAQRSGLEFNIEIMPYSRALFQLRNGEADLIGPVPLGMETAGFYEYARELAWELPTQSDIYVLDPELLPAERLPSLDIGVPLGNAEFFSELLELPVEQFTESSLVNLVQMLATGRIDALLFERASTTETLREQGISGVHYRRVFSIPAGFAVRADEPGQALGQRLDAVFREVDGEAVLEAYQPYLDMPDQGRVDEP